jgi:protein-S-isoprenylcysteine O-methyltransferase Ste14
MSRLPALGPRGEGWVVLQFLLFGLIVLAGSLGPAWDEALRAATSAVGAVAIVAGGLLAVRGIVDLRENLTPLPHPKEQSRLIERGAYRLVRHPIYGGLILAAAGWGLWTASPAALLLTLVLLGFFDLKSRREEHWLEARHPDYAGYRARTKRFFPLVY